MKRLARSILLTLVAALSLHAQGVVSYPFTVGLPPSVPPGNVSCTTSGVTGTTTYYYWVVALWPIGNQAPIGLAPSCVITNANATLNGSNFDVISWIPVTGPVAVNYAVLRNTTATWPGTGTTAVTASQSGTTLNDQSNSLNSFTYSPATGFNGQMLINNISASAPYVNFFGTPTPSMQVNGLQYLDTTGALNSGVAGESPVYTVYGNQTVASLNTGVTIVPATANRTIKIMYVFFQAVGGTAATCTAGQITDTTGVVGVSMTAAGLIVGGVNTDGVPGTGAWTYTTFQTGLTAGAGLKVLTTGSTCTTMTSMNYKVFYTYQ